ncbi:hypothetical protein KBZ21_49370, partial [Streptomyces sp. A73]|nr:hypothetical protein [Streptomyces sp. A73]
DLGATFLGEIVRRSDNSPVCVATPRVEHDRAPRDAFRALVVGEGLDCGRCCNCPLGENS